MRVIHPLDRGAIKDWIDGCGDPERGRDVLATLASNQRGEGWVWSPEINFGPKRVQFPMFETFDSFRARTSEGPAKFKGWADVDLAEVKKKLEVVLKEAEARDPSKLQARIRELEATIRANMHVHESIKVDTQAIERAVRATEKQLHNNYQQTYDALLRTHKKALAAIASHAEELAKLAGMPLPKLPEAPKIPALALPVPVAPRMPIQATIARPARNFAAESNGNLPIGELAVLKAAAQDPEGIERRKITLLTGYKRSSRDAYVSRLAAKGMVGINGQNVKATQEGIDALGSNYEPLPAEGPPLRDYWLNKLPEGERRVLEVLLAAGQPVAREMIDETTGYKRSSRDAYLSRLTSRRVVESVGRGEVKASASLF